MNDTSGLFSPLSSLPANLNSCLASKLKPRLDKAGSTVFSMTWKRITTPAERSLYRLAASARSTSGKGFTGLPSPQTRDHHAQGLSHNPKARSSSLATTAHRDMAPLVTPSAAGSAGETSPNWERRGEKWVNGKTGRVLQTNLATDVKQLAPWATPDVPCGGQGLPTNAKMEGGTVTSDGQKVQLKLRQQVALATWPTPNVADSWVPGHTTENTLRRGDPNGTLRSTSGNLAKDVELKLPVSGLPSNGSPAGTARRGQLNPALPRWLMGFPRVWCVAAIAAHRKLKASKRARRA